MKRQIVGVSCLVMGFAPAGMADESPSDVGSSVSAKPIVSEYPYYDSSLFYLRYFASIDLEDLDAEDRLAIEGAKRQAIAMAFIMFLDQGRDHGEARGTKDKGFEFVISRLLKGLSEKYVEGCIRGNFDTGEGELEIPRAYVKNYDPRRFERDFERFYSLRAED